MGQITKIKYGDSSISLEKSDKLIALRSRKPQKSAMLQKVLLAGGSPINKTLGGFEIVNVKNTPQPAEQTLDALRQDNSVTVGSHVYHSSKDGVPIVPTGKLFVAFKTNSGLAERQKLIDKYHLEIKEELSEDELIAEVTKESPNPLKIARAFQSSSIVEIAEPELATSGKLTGFTLPVDEKLNLQWHLENTVTGIASLAGADARVVEAWRYAKTLGQKKSNCCCDR